MRRAAASRFKVRVSKGESAMGVGVRAAYRMREEIIELLSDVEVANVSTVDRGRPLLAGDEYLDLERLPEGVCLAMGGSSPPGTLLPRKAVSAPTWSAIVKTLSQFRSLASSPCVSGPSIDTGGEVMSVPLEGTNLQPGSEGNAES